MSAIANITIVDSVPANHTLIPIQSSPIAVFREQASAVPLIGQVYATASISPDKGSGLNVVKLSLVVPALELSSGQNAAGYTAAPKVGYANRVNVSFSLPSRGTALQRTDLRVMIKELLGNSQVVDMIQNLVAPY